MYVRKDAAVYPNVISLLRAKALEVILVHVYTCVLGVQSCACQVWFCIHGVGKEKYGQAHRKECHATKHACGIYGPLNII